MCTSFISRKDDIIIGMNFDNNGMKFRIDASRPDWFSVKVHGGRGFYPSFGVSRDGRFFNNLVVDSNGKGLYRRPSSKVTHTTKLVSAILDGIVDPDHLDVYLAGKEVVNTPDWSTHNMICDAQANVWIIEPGRGNLFSATEESDHYLMTNCSLVDAKERGTPVDCLRYRTAVELLESSETMTVERAFTILDAVSQREGEWQTDLSFVYSKADRTVYYHDGDLSHREEYRFT